MMDLESAIQHCKEQVQEQAKKGCYSCAEEHQQLAEWLKELKAYRENTCGDAISREAVIELCEGWWLGHTKEDDFVTEVRALPSVTPQQRTGRWIKQNYGWNWQCSECGFVTPPNAKEIFTFCPN